MPQQDRAHATRRAIMVAAAEEFRKAGYFGTSVGSILHRSGVTKGAFYFHFDSKSALVDELVRYQEELGDRVAEHWLRRGVDPLRTLIGMVDEMAKRTATDIVLAAGMQLAAERGLLLPGDASSYPRWEEGFARLLGQAAADGLLRGDVNIAVAARLLNEVIIGARVMCLTHGRREEYPARIQEAWDFALPLLTSDDWLAGWHAEPASTGARAARPQCGHPVVKPG